MDARSTEKRKRLEEALEHGVVMVHLDARRPGVLVPERFGDDFHLRLNLSLNFSPPDLTVGDWGVRQTLSFARVPHKVAIPWGAIFAISSSAKGQHAWLFPEDMPPELIAAASEQYGLTGEEVEQLKSETAEERPKRVPFRVVEGNLDLPATDEEPSPAPESESAKPTEAAEAKPRALRPVELKPVPEAPPELPVPPPDDKGGRRGHLRLVK